MLGPIEALRKQPNPHRVVPLLIDATVKDRIARMSVEETERALTVVIEECIASYRQTQNPIATYSSYEYVSELFDVHADSHPRSLGLLHLLFAYLLITGFASRESITVAREHSSAAVAILAGSVQLTVETDVDPLARAMWFHSICEKMLGAISAAHDDLVTTLRDRQLAPALTIFGVVPLIRQLALIEQDADSFAAVEELLKELPEGSIEYFHSARRLAEFHLNAGRHNLAAAHLRRAIHSYALVRGRLDAVNGVALLKNVYQLLLNQQHVNAPAVGAAALREAQRLGLSGQIMQLRAIADQFETGRSGIVLPPALFPVEQTDSDNEAS